MTSAQPSQPQAQPHYPPQAYPAPPGGPGPQPPQARPPRDSGERDRAARDSGRGPAGVPAEDEAEDTGHASARRPRTNARTIPRVRKARLRVAKIDPWSVMKVSFLLSIALGICTIVAVSVLWMVLDAMGVFSSIGATLGEATESADGGGFDLESFLSLPRVLLFTSVIAAIDVVLATALATLAAFVYNLSAGFVGGVELTLAEDE
ncbi:DUF3566 domain-containing protein [Streptomyces sp. P38-E01]|uniref:DUF3566 domain-containing protein n=1 Tax=Streptomyces tardus TaxID=2780544 RepID=A0A949JD22_9ACTN|nr:DUF3566 domain-containing protein [Streptomyces tardus]MBU7597812.1 DUF3566 domain-containing protein [Streptomyces tardus]